MKLFEFAYKNRGSSNEGSSNEGSSSKGSSSKGSLSQPEGPPPSIKHKPLHDFVEELHRLLKALPTFDRTGKLIYPHIEDEEPLNFLISHNYYNLYFR